MVRTYGYQNNGLLKYTADTFVKLFETGAPLIEERREIANDWDIAGNLVAERKTGRFKVNGFEYVRQNDESPITNEVEIRITAKNIEVNEVTRYRYDESSRLKTTMKPGGTAFVGDQETYAIYFGDNDGEYRIRNGSDREWVLWGQGNAWRVFVVGVEMDYSRAVVNVAKLNELSYFYDELGNRRRSYLDTTNQAGANKKIDNWYTYDAEGRTLVEEGYLSGGKIVSGKVNGVPVGSTVSYDATGRRLSYEAWDKTSGNSELYKRSEYTYNDLGQVLSSSSRQVTRAANADSSQAPSSLGSASLDFSNIYDGRGNRTKQNTYSAGAVSAITDYSYRGDGQLISQLAYKVASGVQKLSQANFFGEGGMIDAMGNQKAYRYVLYNSDGVSINYRGQYAKTYAQFDTYKEATNIATWSLPGTAGQATSIYSIRGELLEVSATGGVSISRRFSSNQDGLLTTRMETNGTVQSYLYYQGGALANVGNASTPEISDTLAPISADYPSRTPSSYVVNDGDTLERIAQTVWGDAKMWYLIADANGLDPSKPLEPGSSLRIPNIVSSTHNDANTFKPYNADEVIGDITPSPQSPPPPKPKKKKCNGVASVVMVVVAVVVTVFTAGAALAAIAPAAAAAAGGTMAAGVAAITGSAGLVGAGAALVGGAIGSAASQLSGKAMGVVDSFSWKQVAVGGLTAGFTAGLGTVAGTSSTVANIASSLGKAAPAVGYASQGAAAYMISQASSRIVGLETSFSWRDMAASSLSAVVAGSINSNSDLTGRIIRGQVSAHISAWTRDKWFGGGRPDYGQVAADAFGNTLASYVVEKLKSTSSSASSESKNTASSSSVEPSETQSGYDSDRNNPAQTSEVAARSTLDQGYSKPFLSDGVEYVYRETAGRTEILLLDDIDVDAPRSQTFEDLGTAFLNGIESALTTIAWEIVDTPLRVVDMGIALSAVTVNMFRDEGNYWLPRTYSRMSNEYQNSGQTWDQFALEHNPLYAIPVGLGTGLGTAVAAAVAEGDYRPAANFGGAIAGGLLAGKLTSKYGGYGVSVESIGGSGFGRSQRGAINLRFVGPNTGIGKPFNETIEAPNNSKILTYGDDAEATYIIDENSSLTLQAEGVITGPHPGRKKGWLPEPVGGRLPGEHRGHLIPEGGVDNPTYVNHKYNLVSEAPKSNLGLKKTLDSLASKVAAAAPHSEVKFIAQPIRTTNTRPIATSYYVTESGILHTAMSILNR
ncbi:LysM peptidoglycan-binding domain-containing protein [Pseudomonas otitidis]|uniref:LysM peptidoglycan-binding domain-containing protein n=1 Tax=Metapseudomonas otitidis TaxID=319939 RepID=UPI00244C35A4|nr:LysM peptidoglycan-binding domain-containing protein [Pseudomonas otitidis]MDH1108458.1 LysM peptidoglycan-binding domain-containing protein [Pseudomonas otitidis]MDH1160911.1 LysM peptidoglycan-binding domain-containing protein [Pseudomonas otitidis]MDH1167181.1 LysM peptidoglycan-binding domain-containing protein [Pseudomonas otitidis]